MNEYLRIFQNIEQSIEHLLKNEYHSIESVEIKESATDLKVSIQPCIEELISSAAKLKELINSCFEDLADAEDIWSSKIKVSEVSRAQIWQKLGEISACYFKIKELEVHQKRKLINKSGASWDKQIKELRKKWFLDEKNQIRTGVGWPNKEDFNQYLLSETTLHFQKLDNYIKEILSLMLQEVKNEYSVSIEFYINLLDTKRGVGLITQIDEMMQEMQSNFSDLKPEFSSIYLKGIFSVTFKSWKSRWGEIIWIDVVKFKDEVAEMSDQRVHSLISAGAELMKQALEQAIAFYNEFLEEQERYQQETPEQRLAEKAWIDHQRQELEKLQASFNSVLEIPID